MAILEEKNMSKEPPKQSTYAWWDTTKYCRFHKENGHKTSNCFQLRDHIETLIREGHLKDIVFKKVDRADGQKDSRQDGRARKFSPKTAEDEGAINTIFGGPATGKSNRERTQEIREAMEARRAWMSIPLNPTEKNQRGVGPDHIHRSRLTWSGC